MTQAGKGDTVAIHYIGTLDNGRIFDSTPDDSPLVFTIGESQVFPALEKAVRGMRLGEAKNITITSDEAFGPRLDANLLKLGRQSFPPEKEIVVGQKLQIDFKGGKSRIMMVTEVSEAEVTLDGNHPLAGLDLTFALRLDSISSP